MNEDLRRYIDITEGNSVNKDSNMKIDQLLKEEEISELGAKPYGIGARMATGIAAKLGSTKAQASQDVGNRANEIFTAFKNWAYRSGMSVKNVSGTDFNDWLKARGLKPIPDELTLDTYDFTNPNDTKAIFPYISQQAFKTGTLSKIPGQQDLGRKYGSGSASNYDSIVRQIGALGPDELNRLKSIISRL